MKKILFFLMLCSASTFSWASKYEHTHTTSENSNALSKEDIGMLEDYIGLVNGKDGWYGYNQIKTIFNGLSGPEGFGGIGSNKTNKKWPLCLSYMKERCAKEGSRAKECTETLDSLIDIEKESREIAEQSKKPPILVGNSQAKTTSENSNALSKEDIGMLEDYIGLVNGKDGWYGYNQIKTIFNGLSGPEGFGGIGSNKTNKKWPLCLSYMKERCAKEGSRAKECTETLDSLIDIEKESREIAEQSKKPPILVGNSQAKTTSENSNALSKEDIEYFEKHIKIFNDTVGVVKTEKWYHPRHISAILERLAEKELSQCSAEKNDAKTCAARAEERIMLFLQHMKNHCSNEGSNVKACTDAMIQVEESREPFKKYLTNWEQAQKRNSISHKINASAPKLVKEDPKSWWQSVKNKISSIKNNVSNKIWGS